MVSKWLSNACIRIPYKMLTKFVNFFFDENLYGIAVGKTVVPGLSKFVLVMKKLPHILAFIRDS